MKVWTKHGDWTPHSGPWYRHASGRVAISGGYGTTGDNVRGWRKTRFYRVVAIDPGHETRQLGSYCLYASAQRAAEKFLATAEPSVGRCV